jgi:hypothetical protein
MKLLLILAVILQFLEGASQTVVIARKTKKAIYVGADSRKTFYSVIMPAEKSLELPKMVYDTGSMCKILTVKQFNVAFVGWNIDKSIAQAKTSCEKSNTFSEAISNYGKSYAMELRSTLRSLQEKNIMTYGAIMKEYPKTISQAIFFGYEGDSAILRFVYFQWEKGVSSIEIQYSTGKRDLIYGGHIEEIRDTMGLTQTWRRGTIKTIKYLIKKQSDIHTIQVGGPIDILKITRKKRKWIQKKQMCEY